MNAGVPYPRHHPLRWLAIVGSSFLPLISVFTCILLDPPQEVPLPIMLLFFLGTPAAVIFTAPFSRKTKHNIFLVSVFLFVVQIALLLSPPDLFFPKYCKRCGTRLGQQKQMIFAGHLPQEGSAFQYCSVQGHIWAYGYTTSVSVLDWVGKKDSYLPGSLGYQTK